MKPGCGPHPGRGRKGDKGYVHWSPSLTSAPFSATPGPWKVGRPAHRERSGRGIPSLGQAVPRLSPSEAEKIPRPPHLSPDPPSTLEPVQMDGAKENGKRCLSPRRKETSFLAPSTTPDRCLLRDPVSGPFSLACSQGKVHALPAGEA